LLEIYNRIFAKIFYKYGFVEVNINSFRYKTLSI
jgi:hypothetical protein